MFKLQTALFFGCLIFFCLNLKTKGVLVNAMCSAYGEDCDTVWFTHYCCGEYKCVDYRCQTADAKPHLTWAPKGFKCDPTHFCAKHYECRSHRCHPIIGEENKALMVKLVE